jgi:hypothetical protein
MLSFALDLHIGINRQIPLSHEDVYCSITSRMKRKNKIPCPILDLNCTGSLIRPGGPAGALNIVWIDDKSDFILENESNLTKYFC